MISAAGLDLEENFRNFNLKKNGIRKISRFEITPKMRTNFAGLAPEIPINRIPPEIAARMNEEDLRQDFIKAAVSVTAEAILDAGVAAKISEQPRRTGMFLASSIGNLLFLEEGYKEYFKSGLYKISQLIHGMNSYLPSKLADLFGIKGPCIFVSSACTSSLNAILQADAFIKSGVIDRAIVCSVDICLEPGIFLLWNRIRVLSRRTTDPSTACRPYCKTCDGIVLAEAAGCFILERESDSAKAYARICGFGMSNGSHDFLMPSRVDLARAVGEALQTACFRPDQIDFIAGSASGSPHFDHIETQAIRDVFGDAADGVPLFAFKSFLGTTFGTQAVTEGALALRIFRENRLPEVQNVFEHDDRVQANAYYREEDYLGRPMNSLLFINSGFSGNQMAVVYDRPALRGNT